MSPPRDESRYGHFILGETPSITTRTVGITASAIPI